MQIVEEKSIGRSEPSPHGRIGMSTVFRFTDDVPQKTFEFRKRVLHPGAAIGPHRIDHDEIYYLIEGEGEAFSGTERRRARAGSVIYFHAGETVGMEQAGQADLVLIVAYPSVGCP